MRHSSMMVAESQRQKREVKSKRPVGRCGNKPVVEEEQRSCAHEDYWVAKLHEIKNEDKGRASRCRGRNTRRR